MVKKLICSMLAVVLMLSCCACSKNKASSSKTNSDNGGTICKTNYTVLNASFVDFKKKQSDYKFDMNKVFCAQTELNNFYNNVIIENYLIDKVRIKKQFDNYSEKWFDSHVLFYTEFPEGKDLIEYNVRCAKKYKSKDGSVYVKIYAERNDRCPSGSDEVMENYCIFVEFNKADVKDVPSNAFSMSIEEIHKSN